MARLRGLAAPVLLAAGSLAAAHVLSAAVTEWLCEKRGRWRVYDVQDLTPPPSRELRVTLIESSGVANLVKQVIEPRSWVDPNSCTENNGQLVVNHRPEVHRMVERLLEDLRRSQLQVSAEVRALDVREGFLEEIGVDWAGPKAAGRPSGRGRQNQDCARAARGLDSYGR